MATSQLGPGVEAFDNNIARVFLTFIRAPTHSNRYRMSYNRKVLITEFCLNPQRSRVTPEEIRAHLFAREFLLINGQLHRKPDTDSSQPRLVIMEDGTSMPLSELINDPDMVVVRKSSLKFRVLTMVCFNGFTFLP